MLGIDAYFTTKTELPFSVRGAVCFENQAQFSAVDFMSFLEEKLEIWEHTPVIRIKGRKVVTTDKILTADNIICATHYPIRNVPGFYFLRQHQERSYVLALSGCKPMHGMYYGIDKDGLSFRQAGEYLLLGGSSHRTGKNCSGGAYRALKQSAKKYYKNAVEEVCWSAQDCMPHDGIPFIGKYSLFTPHLYVITGFQKWGMTSSMVAAMLLRDELCGIQNPYAKVFSPQRVFFRAAIKDFLIDSEESIKGLIKGLRHIVNEKYPPRCSHMGCELAWNPDEETWECGCHGSRYTQDGDLIDNPAKQGLIND